MRHLQRLAALDQDAAFGAAARAHHDRGRRGQTERAGAGDNQHRHGVHHRHGKRREEQPYTEGRQRQNQHGDGEVRADHIGQPCHGRTRALRLLHQFHHLLQERTAPDLGGTEAEPARAVDGPGEHRGARALVHRHALAGEQRFVHRRFALRHLAIHRNALARTHYHHVARAHFLHGLLDLHAVNEHARHRWLQIHQLADSLAGLPARPRLQRPAEQDQRNDYGRGLIVNFVPPAHRLHQRIEERRSGAQRDQRVHVGRAVTQRAPSRQVERRARVQNHRQGERQLNPRRVRHMQHAVRHPEHQHRRREDHRHYQSPPVSLLRGICRGFLLRHAVPQFLDRAYEIAHLHDSRIELDCRRIGGQIYIGAVHAFGGRQRSLDSARAGGTRHSGNRQVHALRGRGLHAATS